MRGRAFFAGSVLAVCLGATQLAAAPCSPSDTSLWLNASRFQVATRRTFRCAAAGPFFASRFEPRLRVMDGGHS